MNTVEPIRDMNTVLDIADYLRTRESPYAERNYMLWLTGIYLGLRVSDILLLKVRDVRDRSNIYIRDTKTGKENFVSIPDEFREDVSNYVKGKKDYHYLFTSREFFKKKDDKGKLLKLDKPLTRQQAYRILRDAANRFGITRVGTHTMRKTFGYFLYKKTHDIVLVKEILNHADIGDTRRYIGLTQEMKAKAVQDISYRRNRQ